jgi:hypothetical protein
MHLSGFSIATLAVFEFGFFFTADVLVNYLFRSEEGFDEYMNRKEERRRNQENEQREVLPDVPSI